MTFVEGGRSYYEIHVSGGDSTNNITGALKINKAGTLLQIKEGLDNATINEIGSLFPPIDQKKFKEALEALEYNF